MVWGLLSQPTRGLRTKGAIDALKKAGLKVDYLEINKQTNADPAAGVPVFTAYVTSHPDVKLVVIDHGGLTATAETYLKAAHKGPNSIGIAGFDLSPATITAIQGGWTDLVLDQQEWLQGYLPILQTCLTKVYKFAGLYIDTGSGIINKGNVTPAHPARQEADPLAGGLPNGEQGGAARRGRPSLRNSSRWRPRRTFSSSSTSRSPSTASGRYKTSA